MKLVRRVKEIFSGIGHFAIAVLRFLLVLFLLGVLLFLLIKFIKMAWYA